MTKTKKQNPQANIDNAEINNNLFEINDIRKVTGTPSLRAFVNVRFFLKKPHEFLIKDFCVIAGKNGLFVAPPRKMAKDGRWYDIIELESDLRILLEHAILQEYDKQD